MVFRPLAGCGLFRPRSATGSMPSRFSVPLRGVGCFRQGAASATGYQGFPSPCGVWVVSMAQFFANCKTLKFPSPCGVWVVSWQCAPMRWMTCFRPLAGCGLFPHGPGSRPDPAFPSPCGVWVVSRKSDAEIIEKPVSVPLRGVDCFYKAGEPNENPEFPSPCGVWVVSMSA